jgi:hypothetical protein
LPTAAELRVISESENDVSRWIWYWCADDAYLPPQNLSVRAVRTVDNP